MSQTGAPIRCRTSPPGALPLSVLTHRRDDVAVVEVDGELDLATAEALRRSLNEICSQAGQLVVDLARLSFSDLIGVRALEEAAREVKSRGGSLTLVNVGVSVEHALRATRSPLSVGSCGGLSSKPEAVDVGLRPRSET